ncbi:MAG: hypothetical protein OK436_05085 [Thaumarchaeota archaeon]|nr:hypothetical protein [Nitrososphaerota archaeon]
MEPTRMVHTAHALSALLIVSLGTLLLPLATPVYASTCEGSGFSEIQSNFGNDTPGSSYLWFNAVLVESQAPSTPMTITFTGQTIDFTDPDPGAVTLNLPDSEIIFSSSATTATTTFTSGTWVTTVPTSANDGNVFLSGFAYQVPAGGLGQINSPQGVYWTGTFGTSSGTFSVSWRWAAAAYTSFSTSYDSLNVKPIDATSGSAYLNSDHAGTPEAFTTSGNVVQGGTGGGGSNWTGSYSGNGNGCARMTTVGVPEFPIVGSFMLVALVLPLVILIRRGRLSPASM